MDDVTNRRPVFQKHPDTSVIEKLLGGADIGEVVTYDKLSKLLGRDYRKNCLAYGQTARQSLESAGIYFVAIPNEGYRRLSETEKITIVSRGRLRRAKSQTRKGLKVLLQTEMSKLDDNLKREALTTTAQLQAIQLFASSQAKKKIEGRLPDNNMQLALGQTIAMFQE